jgi:hypothetical protein
MERRSFLRALCFAPIAIPVVAKAAAEAPATSFTVVADKFKIGDDGSVGCKYAIILDGDGYVVGLRHEPGEFDRLVADATRRNKARRIS